MWHQDDWHLTAERVAIHRPTSTAVLSDMHLGYVTARRGDGEAVPHFGEVERLDYLAQMLEHLHIKDVVIAGDMVESARHGHQVASDWVAELKGKNIKTHLVPGNHDRGLEDIEGLQMHPDGYMLSSWQVLHDVELSDPRSVIHGHLHPTLRSATLPGEAPCYLQSGNRLLLPAWCDHAAGVSVLGMNEWHHANCHGIVGTQVIALGHVEKLAKQLRRRPRPFRIGFGLTT
jgi:metallophosphoesterase superfamily enzyme